MSPFIMCMDLYIRTELKAPFVWRITSEDIWISLILPFAKKKPLGWYKNLCKTLCNIYGNTIELHDDLQGSDFKRHQNDYYFKSSLEDRKASQDSFTPKTRVRSPLGPLKLCQGFTFLAESIFHPSAYSLHAIRHMKP